MVEKIKGLAEIAKGISKKEKGLVKIAKGLAEKEKGLAKMKKASEEAFFIQILYLGG